MKQRNLSYIILLKSTKIADIDDINITPVVPTFSSNAERKHPIQVCFAWLVEEDFWRGTFPSGSFLWLVRWSHLVSEGLWDVDVSGKTYCGELLMTSGVMGPSLQHPGVEVSVHHRSWKVLPSGQCNVSLLNRSGNLGWLLCILNKFCSYRYLQWPKHLVTSANVLVLLKFISGYNYSIYFTMTNFWRASWAL